MSPWGRPHQALSCAPPCRPPHQAEVQTERQKSVLADNTSSPLPLLTPGGRHDFIVSHDVKVGLPAAPFAGQPHEGPSQHVHRPVVPAWLRYRGGPPSMGREGGTGGVLPGGCPAGERC